MLNAADFHFLEEFIKINMAETLILAINNISQLHIYKAIMIKFKLASISLWNK